MKEQLKKIRQKTKDKNKKQRRNSIQKSSDGVIQSLGQYTINYNQVIGQGTYGKVFKAYKTNSDQQYACKLIRREKIDHLQIYYKDKKMAQQLQKRLTTEGEFQMQLFQCPNIAKMYKTVKNQKGFFFIMEYCQSDLSKLLKKEGYLSQQIALKYFKQIIDGIKFIYEKNAFHRDLKPQNLLLKKQTIKISDFGFVKIFDEIDRKAQSRRNRYVTQSKVGTFRYMSPDILNLLNAEMRESNQQSQKQSNILNQSNGSQYLKNQQKKYQPQKSDVWSLGIILYKMLYGKEPYDGKTYQQMLKKIKQQKLDFPGTIQYPPGKIVKIYVSKSVIKLIKRMLMPYQNQRIQFLKLYNKLQIVLQELLKQKQKKSQQQGQNSKVIKQEIRNQKQRLLIVYNKIMIRIYKDLSTHATLRQIGIINYLQYSYKIMTLLHQKRTKYLQQQNENDSRQINSLQKKKNISQQIIDQKVKQQISQYHNLFYQRIKSLSNLRQNQTLESLLMTIYKKLKKYQQFDLLIKQVQLFLLFLLQLLCLEIGLIKSDYICATDDKTESLKIKSIQNLKNDVLNLIHDHLNGHIIINDQNITPQNIKSKSKDNKRNKSYKQLKSKSRKKNNNQKE